MTTLINDIKYSLRQLRKSPGFTVVVILIVGLGIGANAAIFNVLSALMMRTLPVKNPHQLHSIAWEGNLIPSTQWNMFDRKNIFSYQTFLDFRDHEKGLAEVFGFMNKNESFKRPVFANDQADTVDISIVSGNFFRALGLNALMGQTITPDHDKPDAEPVTVISYAAWRHYFGGDPQAIGQTVTIKNHSFTVIGILPSEFNGLVPGERRDFYVPFSAIPQIEGSSGEKTSDWWVSIMARLAPDAQDSQVRALLETLFTRTAQATPSREPEKRFRIVLKNASCGLMASNKDLIRSLHMLLGLAGIVLVVTCVNLGGLLLTRGIQREHEMAVRKALGAGRWILIRQLLIESIFIVLIGAGFGLILAYWGKTALFGLLLPSGAILDLHSDGWVLAFTLAVALATALLAGLLPAIRSTYGNSVVALKDRSSLGVPRLILGRMLVAIQIGLSLVLLIGAGLFARTLVNLYQIDAGFNTKHLLLFKVNASAAGYEENEAEFHKRLATSLRSLPGVEAVGYSNFNLLSGNSNGRPYYLPNHSTRFSSRVIDVDPSFLTTIGLPLVMGRDFHDGDFESGQKVVIVNQSFIKATFPGENPIEKTIFFSSDKKEEYRIVGVCADFRAYNIKKPSEPTILLPTGVGNSFKVRTAMDPQSLIPVVRKTLAAIDPAVPLSDIKTQAIQLDESIARERCFALLATALALLGTLLSCIGLYGVMAYHVTRRTSEIGIRLALGAVPRNVAWPILRSAILMAVVGMTIGVPVVFATIRIVRSYLFEIEPYDPVTLIGAIILLLAVAVLAAWIPARRAARIDPMVALRYE